MPEPTWRGQGSHDGAQDVRQFRAADTCRASLRAPGVAGQCGPLIAGGVLRFDVRWTILQMRSWQRLVKGRSARIEVVTIWRPRRLRAGLPILAVRRGAEVGATARGDTGARHSGPSPRRPGPPAVATGAPGKC